MSATFVKISKKLWSRISESRWTILYISFAVCQMIVSIIIEAVVLRLNEDGSRALGDLNNRYNNLRNQQNFTAQFIYMNYSYPSYLAQYLSIIDGNIWFIVFEGFLTALCLSANTIEIISIGLINICLLLFGSIQTYQSFKWISRINLQIDLDFFSYMSPTDLANLHLPNTVLYAEIVQLAFLVLFVAASIFFGYKLYGEFGWNIYKKIGAGINTQDAAHNIHTIIIQSVFVAIVIPTLGLGLWVQRKQYEGIGNPEEKGRFPIDD
ncbi:31199_t:CDS:2 [Gigaspora margarita]|uniref:31199_t:CDS:1 n=1 Tax=Gigaspora margarita TaxID=4874 RepID=A0ABN7UWR0_GIGMA|nr:31199_t:CDS:2 [Gigaspora margarita]